MNAADLKLKIFRQVDSLDRKSLEELSGVISNFINSYRSEQEWDALSEKERRGIDYSISELDAGKGVAHDEVMAKYRKKYSNE